MTRLLTAIEMDLAAPTHNPHPSPAASVYVCVCVFSAWIFMFVSFIIESHTH